MGVGFSRSSIDPCPPPIALPPFSTIFRDFVCVFEGWSLAVLARGVLHFNGFFAWAAKPLSVNRFFPPHAPPPPTLFFGSRKAVSPCRFGRPSTPEDLCPGYLSFPPVLLISRSVPFLSFHCPLDKRQVVTAFSLSPLKKHTFVGRDGFFFLVFATEAFFRLFLEACALPFRPLFFLPQTPGGVVRLTTTTPKSHGFCAGFPLSKGDLGGFLGRSRRSLVWELPPRPTSSWMTPCSVFIAIFCLIGFSCFLGGLLVARKRLLEFFASLFLAPFFLFFYYVAFAPSAASSPFATFDFWPSCPRPGLAGASL